MSQATEVGDPPRVVSSPPPVRRRRLVGAFASAVTGALLLGIGLVGGWVAASQKAPVDEHGHSHGEGAGGHSHDAGGGHASAPKLTPQTLKNLGVVIGDVAPSEFVRTRDVPAVVAERPGTLLPASATVAGVLEEILVVPGQRIEAGAPVARVRRDAFPRPVLLLTEPILQPLNEDFHEAVSKLRSSSQSLTIAREDLARVKKALAGTPESLPSRIEIDLRNDERRAIQALETAREEAERHGLTHDEIDAIEAGKSHSHVPPPADRVLARSGLWSEEATQVLAALPDEVRARPYAVAVVAELVGSRALTSRMADAIETTPELAAAFLDVAGLIQQGWTVEGILSLTKAGALEPIVTIRAPMGPKDWDVDSVRVRVGERVEIGTTVAECRDASTVQLELAPAGLDLPAVSSALTSGETVTATPLVAGSGLALEGLKIHRLESSGEHAGTAGAEVLVANKPLSESTVGGRVFRTWAVRPGTRYVVRVPLERLPNRFVLPATALASQGPDTVLLLEDGDGFRVVPVHVEHRDARIAVVAQDGAVFPGDRVVLDGAFAVLLALQTGSGAVDPHAGCGHAH